MGFFKKLIFWIAFSLCAVESNLAQQEQAFRLDQSDSYMRMADTLKLLAVQNSPEVQTQLAEMYERGLGVPQNFYKAIGLYRKAALHGFEPAQIRLQSLGVSLLADSKTEIVDQAKVVKIGVNQKMQITVNVGGVASSKPIFDVWSPHRIVLKGASKKKRMSRQRLFMSDQGHPVHRLLSSGRRPRAAFRSAKTN